MLQKPSLPGSCVFSCSWEGVVCCSQGGASSAPRELWYATHVPHVTCVERAGACARGGSHGLCVASSGSNCLSNFARWFSTPNLNLSSYSLSLLFLLLSPVHQENSFCLSVLSPALEDCINLYNLSGKQSIAIISRKRMAAEELRVGFLA